MDALKNVLKDYGPAIGPAVAFLFGVIALLVKQAFDRMSARRSAERLARNLERLILANPPPAKLFPTQPMPGSEFKTADQTRNGVNMTRFYTRLLAIKPVLAETETSINEAGTLRDIQHLSGIRWWFDIIFKEVEKVRSADIVSDQDHRTIMQDWETMASNCRTTDPDWDYLT